MLCERTSILYQELEITKYGSMYAGWIWVYTFLIYAAYHMSRKPISVVKTVLNENCSKINESLYLNDSHFCDYAPFDGDNSQSLLGLLDSAYLFMYAFAMFFSGVIAERSRLNVFLSIGMMLSGIMTAAFGFGYTFNIHVFSYFFIVQSSGWPGVVAVMGNWYGKRKRGLIMGIWNSHTSVGNILGTLIATAFLNSRWDFSFIVPGIIIFCLGVFALFFLIPEPENVGLENPNYPVLEDDEEQPRLNSSQEEEVREPLLSQDETSSEKSEIINRSEQKDVPISFLKALTIPGVMEFAFSLFFSKLVSYTFLYWLPHYLADTTDNTASESGLMSTFFDIGGIIGGILAGMLNDWTEMPASVCTVLLIFAVVFIYIYQLISVTLTRAGNIVMLIVVGLLVNGPYALITTAVSAALGTHSSLQGNSKALSTVTSIIDGTGSLGAAVGPLITGVLTNLESWSYVFIMMIIADICSCLLLVRLVKREITIQIERLKS
ncbi:Glucose-6-phosphate exchanger [Armadillidium nasatum]|uniref:Sugar phosphate exchanger 3 n=1 Tax=Armadillidium nasatum TaxID=96803 RepID=A0A5N5TBB0_9CRUS|nr:Glucose-6-phosphate exchanger [Armadillidium nasatum]